MSAISDASDAPATTSASRILIVDDDEPTSRALAVLLGRAGFETTVALRGVDALQLAEAERGRFEAAIVDIHLPDISGLVVSQKLRGLLGPEAPIVVLSGDTAMQMLNSLSHVGASYFFSKPVNANQLLDSIRHWISLSQRGSRASA